MSYQHYSTTGEPLPKRLHIETSPSPDGSYTHRWSIPNRASLNNAADTPYFLSSRSLAYHFVNLIDPVETSPGELASCILRCGVCRRNRRTWRKSNDSSTSNIVYHMSNRHPLIWEAAKRADEAALGTRSESVPSEQGNKDIQSRLDSEFDPDAFDHLVARWIVASKETFANSIENEEFRELIDLLRPGHKLRIDSIKERVKDMTDSENSQ
ncbi:hAT family dimerization protein [Ceratobasidium sp. AG-Ba]|nr:hAT family dimerization protein [Ceratobasidium sp. AG-Ba]